MIIGIDTSVGTAVALVEADGFVRAALSSANPLGHAEIIGSFLERALAEAEIPPAELTHVASGMGPGPFTGLRVGIAAARAFALGRSVPVVPVASHDAAALDILIRTTAQGDDPGMFAIVTDARRREFAYTVYRGLDDDGLPVRAHQPALIPRDQLSDHLASVGAQPHETTEIPAAALATVAARAVAAGRSVATSEALYLRSPDVTPPAARKRVTA